MNEGSYIEYCVHELKIRTSSLSELCPATVLYLLYHTSTGIARTDDGEPDFISILLNKKPAIITCGKEIDNQGNDNRTWFCSS